MGAAILGLHRISIWDTFCMEASRKLCPSQILTESPSILIVKKEEAYSDDDGR